MIGRQVRVDGLHHPSRHPAHGLQVPHRCGDLYASGANTELAKRDNRRIFLYGIPKRGVTQQQASSELDAIATRLAKQYPAVDKDIGVSVQTFHQRLNGGPIRVICCLMLAAVGFVLVIACANVANMMLMIGDHVLAVDVNQGWSIAEAREQAPPLEQFGLAWLEEPLRADRPSSEWRSLPEQVSVPLAGGENIAGSEAFATVLAEGVLSVIQPDVAKWGGVTGCIAVGREVVAAKRTDCPHYLGGGIGLVASAHLLAACNGGWLEVDSNTNPLRNDFCGAVTVIRDGEIMLPELPGLGIAPDIAAMAMYRTL